jgi:hypothetical protein
MKSEQAVLPNPCLEEEEDHGKFLIMVSDDFHKSFSIAQQM